MTNDLGRYERMAQRTKVRLKNEQVRDYVEQGSRELVEELTEAAALELESYGWASYREGPPAGCHTCYAWNRPAKFRTYAWHHGPLIDRIVREVTDDGYDDEPYPVDVCMCPCHGPDGQEYPRIALAAG